MSNIQQLITENLDIWANAIKPKSAAGRGRGKAGNGKYELYGIKKLRELILELAVRGLLVPQDVNDEPANDLLNAISDKKSSLLIDGKIKKRKPLPVITDEEKKVELPKGWAYERLGNLVNVLNGRAYKKHEMLSEGIPLLRVGNLFTSKEWYYSDLELEPEKYIDDGDLIYAWSASFGPFIWQGGKVIYHYHVWKLDLFDAGKINKNYLCLFLQEITDEIKASGNGIAMIHMTKERMEKLLTPFPPLAEQHRIVAKVDELMALCDQLEQQTETSITAHQTLVETVLEALTRPSAANELDASAIFFEHFDTLFTTEQSIDQLKQTILQLAVMGKLVPQDPNDEPASELLKKIAAEKEKLIQEKKIKKQKALSPISDEEKPFELPEGWGFKRLGDLSYIFSGNSFKSHDFNESGGIKVIKITNAGVGELIDTNDYLPESYFFDYESFRVIEGDLILALTRPYISNGLKISICPNSYNNSLLNQRVAAIRAFIENKFLYQYMQSVFVLGLYQERFGSSGLQPNLKMGDVTELVVPVPPIEEQHRIVTKVNELMTLCDQLKQKLADSKTSQLHLADAMAEQAVG